jgi:hypothetical protein
MHYHGPYANPAHEGEVIDSLRCDNVIDGVVEDRDWTCEDQPKLRSRRVETSLSTSHANND